VTQVVLRHALPAQRQGRSAGPAAAASRVRANWKAAGEQSAADGYHTLTLHRWLGEVGNYKKETAPAAT